MLLYKPMGSSGYLVSGYYTGYFPFAHQHDGSKSPTQKTNTINSGKQTLRILESFQQPTLLVYYTEVAFGMDYNNFIHKKSCIMIRLCPHVHVWNKKIFFFYNKYDCSFG